MIVPKRTPSTVMGASRWPGRLSTPTWLVAGTSLRSTRPPGTYSPNGTRRRLVYRSVSRPSRSVLGRRPDEQRRTGRAGRPADAFGQLRMALGVVVGRAFAPDDQVGRWAGGEGLGRAHVVGEGDRVRLGLVGTVLAADARHVALHGDQVEGGSVGAR